MRRAVLRSVCAGSVRHANTVLHPASVPQSPEQACKSLRRPARMHECTHATERALTRASMLSKRERIHLIFVFEGSGVTVQLAQAPQRLLLAGQLSMLSRAPITCRAHPSLLAGGVSKDADARRQVAGVRGLGARGLFGSTRGVGDVGSTGYHCEHGFG